jgi:hypothetical protein
MRALSLAALPLLLFLGFALVELPLLRLHSEEVRPPSRIADPEASSRARRVVLGLAARGFPQSDRYLSHPAGAAFPDPPLFDAALGFAARAFLGQAAERGPDGGPDEPALEAILSQVGPALFLLLLVALAFALRGESGAGLPLAVAVLVLSPELWRSCAAGRLEVGACAAMLLALQIGLLGPAWRARESLDRLLAALLAGLVTGIGLACTPLFTGAALGAWGGLCLHTASASGSEARDRARAGLIFALSAFLPAQIPALEAAWRSIPRNPAGEWGALTSSGLLLGCLPFGLAMLPREGTRLPRRALPWLCALLALALVALVILAPPGAGPARPLRAALRLESGPAGPELQLALAPPLALLGAALWIAALLTAGRRELARLSGPERLHLWVAIGLGALATLFHPGAGLLFLLPVAVLQAQSLAARTVPRRAAAALTILALLVGALRATRELSLDLEREDRLALLQSLRWLREETPAPGAWTAAGAGQDYGVLSEPELSAYLPYHARRPAFATDVRSCADPEAQARVRAVLELEDGLELALRARRLGARYLLLRAGSPLHARLSPLEGRGLERVHPAPGYPVAAYEILRLLEPDGAGAEAVPQRSK